MRRSGDTNSLQRGATHILPLRSNAWTAPRIISWSATRRIRGRSNAKMRLRVLSIVRMRCHHVGMTHGLREITARNTGLRGGLVSAAGGVRGRQNDVSSSRWHVCGSCLAWIMCQNVRQTKTSKNKTRGDGTRFSPAAALDLDAAPPVEAVDTEEPDAA